MGAGLAALLALLPTGTLVAGVNASGPLPVSITTSANPVDAGLPFELVANVPGPVGSYFYNWTDSQGGSNTAPTWVREVPLAGNLTITLEVRDPWGDRGWAGLTLLVRPPPTLTVGSSLKFVDAGLPAPFFIAVTGGVPPITASWISSGGAANGSAGWPLDGNYSETTLFPDPGPAWVLVRAVDSLGDSTSTAELVTEVVPSGTLQLTTNDSVGEVGWPVGVEVLVEGGAPPFEWSFSSSLPFAGGVAPFGSFPADGLYRWNLPFDSAGTATINLTITDAVGAIANAGSQIPVEPPLSVNVTSPGREAGTPFELLANVTGGLPPYTYALRLSDGEGSQGRLVSPGVVAEFFNPAKSGNYSVGFDVTDALGQTWNSTEFLQVAAGPLPAASTSLSGWAILAGAVGIGAAGLFGAFYLHHRLRRTPPATEPPGSSALPMVRELMQKSQTLDRETLVLLGEEAGETSGEVQAALETLVRSGEVSTEPGPVDDEVLRWKGTGPPAEPREEPR